jgi:hypothetical protein
MPKKIVTIILLIAAIAIGIGITILATPLLGVDDQQTQIIIGVVLSVFVFISLYFMSKGHGGS